MFERYTASARRALFFARHAVSRGGGTQIEPEHLLLGLLRVQHLPLGQHDATHTTTAATLLQSAGVDRGTVERRMAVKEPRLSTSVEMPFSSSCTRSLTDAAREADQMSARPITTGHLLLGLLQADDTEAWRVLHAAGLRINDVRGRVEADIAAGVEDDPSTR